ncbi:MAG: hypothetical protein QOJ53_1445 [Sphingomonadales bacterium]|nr:hypothetical protein [Sphingomonadales bacterium]
MAPPQHGSVRGWQEWRDSNPRPSVLETDALTGLSYTPKPPASYNPVGARARSWGGGRAAQAAASFLLWPSIALTVAPVTGREKM